MWISVRSLSPCARGVLWDRRAEHRERRVREQFGLPSISMMSACLVIAQNVRTAVLTHQVHRIRGPQHCAAS